MKKIEAIIRKSKFEDVKQAIKIISGTARSMGIAVEDKT